MNKAEFEVEETFSVLGRGTVLVGKLMRGALSAGMMGTNLMGTPRIIEMETPKGSTKQFDAVGASLGVMVNELAKEHTPGKGVVIVFVE